MYSSLSMPFQLYEIQSVFSVDKISKNFMQTLQKVLKRQRRVEARRSLKKKRNKKNYHFLAQLVHQLKEAGCGGMPGESVAVYA